MLRQQKEKKRRWFILKNNNLIFILIDACRARNLGCYGHEIPTSPFIDKLASKGTLFTRMFSTTNCTDTSLMSIFTGLYPRNHGIRHHADQITEEEDQKAYSTLWLPEILKKAGYYTISMDTMTKWHKKGFDFYGPVFEPTLLKQNTPFFLFVHFWQTHYPVYTDPNIHEQFYEDYYENIPGPADQEILDKVNGKWKANLRNILWEKEGDGFNWRLAKYNSAIRTVDNIIQKMFNQVEEFGPLDQTYWIVTADHGESLGEHDIFFDHHGLYDTTVHVPLIMGGPNIPPIKNTNLLSQVELFPTILDLLKINKPCCDGVSLVGNINYSRRVVELEESYTQTKFGIRTERFKLLESDVNNEIPIQPSLLGILDVGEYPWKCRYCGKVHGGINELYDLQNDPEETKNLLGGIK